MKSARRLGLSIAVLIVLALLGAAPALGANHTWIGPAGGLWSSAGNWVGGVPTSGESPGGTVVTFGSSNTSTMNIPGLVVDEIHFTGANNTISGDGTHPLGINGSTILVNVVSDAGGNTLASNLPLALSGAATEASSSAGTLTLAGQISGSFGLAFKGIGGDFSLTGANSYTGGTAVLQGALHISQISTFAIVGSSISVGTGGGPGAQLIDDNSSDISPNTDVVVNSDGVFNTQSHSDFAKTLTVDGGSVTGTLSITGALTMNDGTVAIPNFGTVFAGSLNLTGGTISGTGSGVLALSGDIHATSSSSGPATVSAPVRLSASPTVTVTPGTAPEFQVTGAIGETGGSRGLTKAGTGTMLMSANNTYTSTTTVSAGTLLVNGSESGAFSVGQNGTLGGSWTVGATTVAGVLSPAPPGLNTGALSFGPTGTLKFALSSVTAAAIPTVTAAGTVAIDPSAVLNLVVAPGTSIPHGTALPLIAAGGSTAIGGEFTGVASGSVLTTADGVPLVVNYAGGDGNDLTLTADHPPQAGAVSGTPNPVVAGKPVALSVTESDADQDSLTTTWDFGDGHTGTGAATSHTYAAAGKYTVVATVSDGVAQAQSASVINVTAASTGGGGSSHGGGSSGTSTFKWSGYGAVFVLTVPKACVRNGAPFTVTLRVVKSRKTRKRNRNVLAKVTKVVFTLDGGFKTARSAPFRVRLAASGAAAAGRTQKLGAKAYVTLRDHKHRTKSLTVAVKVC